LDASTSPMKNGKDDKFPTRPQTDRPPLVLQPVAHSMVLGTSQYLAVQAQT
jgi:hypothetical protein